MTGRESLCAARFRVLFICAHCGKPWPCQMAGLYPHRKKRGAAS